MQTTNSVLIAAPEIIMIRDSDNVKRIDLYLTLSEHTNKELAELKKRYQRAMYMPCHCGM
jgi:hypothetical protein